jgi:hypothetical protein
MHGEPDTEGEEVALLLDVDVPVELAVSESLCAPAPRASRATIIRRKFKNR